jgi:hypothetical protein
MTFFVERDRLFDEDVLAGIEGRSRHFEMQKRRRQNGDDVDSRVREQCAIVREHLQRRIARCDRSSRRLVDVGDGDDPGVRQRA